MERSKTILIIDDSIINREILCEILKPEYRIIEAENGAQALDILKKQASHIDAIILDIIMPEMGGYEFMEHIRVNKLYSQIPVIILTEKSDRASEKKALENGAWDFVSKPYDAEIVKLRLKNVIARSQMALLKELNRITNYDSLTGVYSKNKFFTASRAMLNSHPDRQFAFLRVDIDRFKLINSFFGTANGDKLLKFLANGIKEFAQSVDLCTYGRIDADVFGIFTPYLGKERTEELLEDAVNRMKLRSNNYNIILVYGVYVVKDTSIPISQMCDRAALAAKTVKGNYLQSYAFYNEDMRLSIENEQTIINEMSDALANGQFVPFYQPKYDVRTNKPVGAEALSRWIHPEKGFISPGVFIPIFEKNGFISKLDFYIWECVCKQLKEWKDKGVPLFPVSVNVSRVNLYNPNLTNIIVALTEKYGIEPKYFNIEITESVYTDKNIMIDKVTNDLREKGFTILMDDFGSGYSSLNVLKDVKVDVLKMDMMFMFKAKYEGRAETIIASVIRMAKWLNIPVIAEGVDKREQVDFLRGLGCDYIQGFYFAKPMPAADYEKLISSQDEFIMPANEHGFSGEAFWSKNSSASISIDTILQPAMVIEYMLNGSMDIVSVNKAFNEEFGFASDLYGKYNILNSVDDEYKELFTKTIQQVLETKNAAECDYSMHNAGGRKIWLNIHFKYVNRTDVSVVLIALITDITNTKIMDEHINAYQKYIKEQMNRKFNILIVSGEENCNDLEKILKDKYAVCKANTKDEGLKILSENKIDLIFFDVALYESDDDKFPFNVDTDDGRNIPVIIITPTHDEIECRTNLKNRAGDFVMNPFVAEMVRSRTANLLTINTTNIANAKFLNNL